MSAVMGHGGRAFEPLSVNPRVHAVLGIVLGLMLTGALGLALRELLDPRTLPIREVRIDGQFEHLSPAELQRIVAAEINSGFFRVDVDAIRAALLGQPWVDRATVRRVWPDRLQIEVTEQRPAAYWGREALLNTQGVAFRPARASFPAGLPRLAGPPGSERRVLARYRELSALFAARGLRIAAVELTPRRAWRFRIDNGPRVLIGRTDFDRRVARLVQVLDRVVAGTEMARTQIDLRYTNGLAVRVATALDDDF